LIIISFFIANEMLVNSNLKNMNRKLFVEFLIGNGFLALRVGKRYFGMVPVDSVYFNPVYLPVKEKSYRS
jgi:hypothetical protein